MNALAVRARASMEAGGDVMSMLLADKRSENTKRAYKADLVDFFGREPTQEDLAAFFAQDQSSMAVCLNAYKADLLSKGIAEATINRRLAAVKSLLRYARRIGQCSVDPAGLVDAEKVKAYRDTTGIDQDAVKRLLQAPDTSTLRGKRDAAILRLLWENGLRRAEVCKLDITDLLPTEKRLYILGKGKGTQKEGVTLSERAVTAILEYLQADGRLGAADGPLFVTCDRRGQGTRLTADGLYYTVNYYAKRAGIDKRLSPHRIRHSAITAALDATGGDVRKVQKLSRHAKIETLMIYDDNRKDAQGEVTDLLSAIA
jgi:integrase/recombinase XerC